MPDEQSDERRLSLPERLALVYERLDVASDGTLSILSRKTGDEVYRKPGAELREKNTLDPELRKVQDLAATTYPARPESSTATPQSTPPAVHRKAEREERTQGR